MHKEPSLDARELRFRDLFTAHSDRILAYALRRTPSVEDAGDAIAETFLVAWRRLDEVPSEPESLFWLYGVCRRVLSNQRRRIEAGYRLSARLEPVRSENAREWDPGTELDAVLAREALSRLDEGQQEILMLVAWEGLTASELATLLGCSIVAARIRVHRARKCLSMEMEKLGLLREREGTLSHSKSGENATTKGEETVE